MHHLQLDLVFPAGISPGAGGSTNLLIIAQDGLDRPVLRGTALAGALRAAFACRQSKTKFDKGVSQWFGADAGDREGEHASKLRVSDIVLEVGQGRKSIRTHNAIDRHTGSALPGGLFSIETLPPGTSGTVILTLDDPDNNGVKFLQALIGELQSGIFLGGRSARGIGRVQVTKAIHRAYDFADLKDHAAFLDARWDSRVDGKELTGEGSAQRLTVDISLAVPRGQDICIGDGVGLDHTVQPQAVIDKNGVRHWRLPGSALRGAMRAWITRLAALEGCKVADSFERQSKADWIQQCDQIGWGFIEPDERAKYQLNPKDIKCPVMQLFGSMYAKGRIHISDAISEHGNSQSRQHVSIDRISGGANEGVLFSHQALTNDVLFQLQITVDHPTEPEARWLCATLRALDMGLIRIGTSKSAGRLALTKAPIAKGLHADIFKQYLESDKCKELTEEQKRLALKPKGFIDKNSESLHAGAVKASAPSATQANSASIYRGSTQESNRVSFDQADPSVLGEPFHNPYTFIRFGENPIRSKPTPLTIDEIEKDRVSGVLELKICTLSPLLSCSPDPKQTVGDHKHYPALAIGNDVIVPASGVRGSLRTLMTILTGGTLDYLDEGIFLTQGRDVNLGPTVKQFTADTLTKVFLAEVVKPGNSIQSGTIRLGRAKLVELDQLEKLFGDLTKHREQNADPLWASIQNDPQDIHHPHGNVTEVSLTRTDTCDWKLKLSGELKCEGKREAAFLADGSLIDLRAELWQEYQGRHRHSDHKKLTIGDLIWLQPRNPYMSGEIDHQRDIISLQWARWGRAGDRLKDLISKKHKAVMPDSFQSDGLVDEVTNLFGQIPSRIKPDPAGPFAARVRPENLVFQDALDKCSPETLAPLSTPHPGCVAFYRDSDIDKVGLGTPLRGYKVYRNTKERGENAPWLFSVQGIYDDRGELKVEQAELKKTCDLLPEGRIGSLRISFRALSPKEFALLVMACSVDWRLGGGKPLGLGHCRVTAASWRDEDGKCHELFTRAPEFYPDPVELAKELADLVKDIAPRVLLWHTSQRPVNKLRYPRAVSKNKYKKISRGGHVWFGRHATPEKNSKPGLQILRTTGRLQVQAGGKNQISPQMLPALNGAEPPTDLLYGYDLISTHEHQRPGNNDPNLHENLERFDPGKHSSE